MHIGKKLKKQNKIYVSNLVPVPYIHTYIHTNMFAY
jgi:hypothetical protein